MTKQTWNPFTMRWRKVIRELWYYKARTALIVIVIAIGVFAVGTISYTWVLLKDNLDSAYATTNPSNAELVTASVFNDDLLTSIQKMPEVKAVEGRYLLRVRVQVSSTEWRVLNLMVLKSFEAQDINVVYPDQGEWPPPKQTLLLERTSLDWLNGLTQGQTLTLGDNLTVELSNGKQRQLQISGTTHDINQLPSNLASNAFGYISFDTLESLIGLRQYNALYFIAQDNALNKSHVEQVTDLVINRMEAQGQIIARKFIPEPGRHLLGDMIDALLFILGALGILSLLLSAFLVVNTISALLTRQLKEIGMMKTIGAVTEQILVLYIEMVLILGILGVMVAIGPSIFVARILASFTATQLNFDIVNTGIPALFFILELAAGLLMPLVSASIPITKGIQITVREAISDVGGNLTVGKLDYWLSKIKGLPIAVSYAYRNAFRRKPRLVLTLITLMLAGAIFTSVIIVQESLSQTQSVIEQYWQQDIGVSLPRPYRLEKVIDIALRTPGVVAAEGRLERDAIRVYGDGKQGTDPVTLLGLDSASPFLQPTLLAGRWLNRQDNQEVVVNIELVEANPDLGVGKFLTLKIEGRETQWQVVGVVTGQVVGGGGFRAPIAYANYTRVAQELGEFGRVDKIEVGTEEHSSQFQQLMSDRLEKQFRQAGITPSGLSTKSSRLNSLSNIFSALVYLLLAMTLLFAVVGGLGLMGTMSLNVLERTREFGVAQAIGATDITITQIVLVEGIFIGILSWAFSLIVAYPLSLLFTHNLGNIFLGIPLSYVFPLRAVWLWFVLSIILASIASFLPAYNAANMNIREGLAYEG